MSIGCMSRATGPRYGFGEKGVCIGIKSGCRLNADGAAKDLGAGQMGGKEGEKRMTTKGGGVRL